MHAGPGEFSLVKREIQLIRLCIRSHCLFSLKLTRCRLIHSRKLSSRAFTTLLHIRESISAQSSSDTSCFKFSPKIVNKKLANSCFCHHNPFISWIVLLFRPSSACTCITFWGVTALRTHAYYIYDHSFLNNNSVDA